MRVVGGARVVQHAAGNCPRCHLLLSRTNCFAFYRQLVSHFIMQGGIHAGMGRVSRRRSPGIEGPFGWQGAGQAKREHTVKTKG